MLIQNIHRRMAELDDRVALTFNGQSHTYGSLRAAIDRLKGSLTERGIGRGDRVAIMLPNCPHFVICHLAVLQLGAVSVPINVQQKGRELCVQLDDAEVKAFIGWTNLAAECEKTLTQNETVRLRAYLGDTAPEGCENLVEMIAAGAPLVECAEVNAPDVAVILYTAGVSGLPRGVELTSGGLLANALELARLLGLRETDRVLTSLPFSNVCALTAALHLPLCGGAELQVHSRFHPGDVLSTLCDLHTTMFIGNPSAYAMMVAFPSADKCDLSRLRYAVSCEAKLPDQTAQDVEERLKMRIFEGYGTTETGGLVTLNLFPQLAGRGSVGRPIGGHEVAILNADGAQLNIGEVGSVAARGPSVMSGYHNRPDRTKQTFVTDWLRTGDLGTLDEQGELRITSHGSEVIMKGGFPVYCREVETVVEGLPHVQEVAVIGVPDPVFGEEIKAFVVLKEGAVIGPSEIIEYVKERLAVYKCPKVVRLCKELPRTPSGKLLRSQLREEKVVT